MYIQAKITGARTEQVTKTRKEGANVTTSATNKQYDPTKAFSMHSHVLLFYKLATQERSGWAQKLIYKPMT